MNHDSAIGGEKRRSITFNTAKPHEVALYKFSQSINLSQFVKECLWKEYQSRYAPQVDVKQVRRES